MPKNVQVGNQVVEFPDSMSDDAIGGIIKAQQMAKPVAPTSQPMDVAHSIMDSIVNTVRGPVQAATTPFTPQEAADTRRFGGGNEDPVSRLLYRGLVEPTVTGIREGRQALASGDTLGARQGFVSAVPVLGPMLKNAQQDAIQRGGPAGVAGLLTNVGMLGLGAKEPGAEATPRYSPISPQEMAARNISGKALMSGGGAFDPIADALMREKGNIEQFAQQKGVSTRTPLEASRVVEDSKNALNDFYRNKMVAPAEDGSQIPVPMGSEVGQRAINGSQYATISEIDNRIQTLNNLTRPAAKNALALDDATARAKMAALEQEKQILTDILDNTVAKRMNLDPGVVQAVRQSMGARAQLADQLNLAANQASTATGKVEQMSGGPLHPSTSGVVSAALGKVAAKFTGGPEGQINKAFGKYYPKLEVEPTIGNPASIEELRSPLSAPLARALARNRR